MSQQIDRQSLARILQAQDVETVSLSELVQMFREEEGISAFLPDGVCVIDPRNGDSVLFHSARARRPHDNRPPSSRNQQASRACAICQGETTGVIDVAELSEGFTFINKNLYPVLYPFEIDRPDRLVEDANQDPTVCQTAYGMHFLQWTSSWHDRDWHNMPLADRRVVLERLAALERKLLTQSESGESSTDGERFVLIFKNYGYLVGGSLAHGHQQIALSNVLPRRMGDDVRFEQEHGEKFSAYLRRENPAELLIRDYGSAVLVVPYFMRRPYDMMLLVTDVSKRQLYELTGDEIIAVAEGWHDALRAIHWIMPRIGRELAYNVITHNGPGAGLYFEFLPYTQEIGGFEHLGVMLCQGNPKHAAIHIRETLKNIQ